MVTWFDLLCINETKLDLATLKTSLEVIIVKLHFELSEGELSPCCVRFQHSSFYSVAYLY